MGTFEEIPETIIIEAKKIESVQEFLIPQSGEAISRLEGEKRLSVDKAPGRIGKAKLNLRIEQSESVFKNNRYKAVQNFFKNINNGFKGFLCEFS